MRDSASPTPASRETPRDRLKKAAKGARARGRKALAKTKEAAQTAQHNIAERRAGGAGAESPSAADAAAAERIAEEARLPFGELLALYSPRVAPAANMDVMSRLGYSTTAGPLLARLKDANGADTAELISL